MGGKWKIFLVILSLFVCFGLVYVIAGNSNQSSFEQIKKASMSKTEVVKKKKEDVKEAEEALGKADITVNKNMVPFDTRSPFVTSGIRVGVSAITTRGLKEADMERIADFIDRAITHRANDEMLEEIADEVNNFMENRPLFAY